MDPKVRACLRLVTRYCAGLMDPTSEEEFRGQMDELLAQDETVNAGADNEQSAVNAEVDKPDEPKGLWDRYRHTVQALTPDEGGGYCAYYPTLGRSTVSGNADTKEDAVEDLKVNSELVVEIWEETGFTPPAPDTQGQVSGDIDTKSAPKPNSADTNDEPKERFVIKWRPAGESHKRQQAIFDNKTGERVGPLYSGLVSLKDYERALNSLARENEKLLGKMDAAREVVKDCGDIIEHKQKCIEELEAAERRLHIELNRVHVELKASKRATSKKHKRIVWLQKLLGRCTLHMELNTDKSVPAKLVVSHDTVKEILEALPDDVMEEMEGKLEEGSSE